MTKEIEFLQGAFESYKSTLHTETTDKWNAREEDLKLAHSNDKQQALQELSMWAWLVLGIAGSQYVGVACF